MAANDKISAHHGNIGTSSQTLGKVGASILSQ